MDFTAEAIPEQERGRRTGRTELQSANMQLQSVALATLHNTDNQPQVAQYNEHYSQFYVSNANPLPEISADTQSLGSSRLNTAPVTSNDVPSIERPIVPAYVNTKPCYLCHKRLNPNESLKDHILKHLEETHTTNTECQLCGRTVSSTKSVYNHYKTLENKDVSRSNSKKRKVKGFTCPGCKKSFKRNIYTLKTKIQHIRV